MTCPYSSSLPSPSHPTMPYSHVEGTRSSTTTSWAKFSYGMLRQGNLDAHCRSANVFQLSRSPRMVLLWLVVEEAWSTQIQRARSSSGIRDLVNSNKLSRATRMMLASHCSRKTGHCLPAALPSTKKCGYGIHTMGNQELLPAVQ